MSNKKTGNFASNGVSEKFTCSKFTIFLGDADGTNFGGGTVTLKMRSPLVNGAYTSDATTYTAQDVIRSEDYVGDIEFYLELTSSTTPDLNYAIVYE